MTETKIRKEQGVAGQIAYHVTTKNDDGTIDRVSFIGSVYGGPVVMKTGYGLETFVSDPGRFGAEFDRSWVDSFLAAS